MEVFFCLTGITYQNSIRAEKDKGSKAESIQELGPLYLGPYIIYHSESGIALYLAMWRRSKLGFSRPFPPPRKLETIRVPFLALHKLETIQPV